MVSKIDELKAYLKTIPSEVLSLEDWFDFVKDTESEGVALFKKNGKYDTEYLAKQYQEYLANREEYYGYNYIYEVWVEEIENQPNFEEYCLIKDMKILVSHHDDAGFNAEVSALGNEEYLILVNQGLFAFIKRVGRLLSLILILNDTDEKLIDDNLFIEYMAELVYKFRKMGVCSHTGEQNFMFKFNTRYDTIKGITDNAMKFVVCHEYAHIMRGHLSSGIAKNVRVKDEYIEVLANEKDWEKEFEADIYGVTFLLNSLSVAKLTQIEFQSLLSSPIFFLKLDELMNSVDSLIYPNINPSYFFIRHPPSNMRIQMIKNLYSDRFPNYNMDFVNFIENNMSSLNQKVVNLLSELMK